ncbi:hypothetical protein [Pseudaeromonas pectinilytica]|jgi:hypothetical protein|uniref:Uncharacterized protein n=1 Tax=uncultured organism TaxID=155900 RepID=A0A385FVG9_9ZZZZ|nr:hypothetical protein TRI8_00021 [uncultured organism]
MNITHDDSNWGLATVWIVGIAIGGSIEIAIQLLSQSLTLWL